MTRARSAPPTSLSLGDQQKLNDQVGLRLPGDSPSTKGAPLHSARDFRESMHVEAEPWQQVLVAARSVKWPPRVS